MGLFYATNGGRSPLPVMSAAPEFIEPEFIADTEFEERWVPVTEFEGRYITVKLDQQLRPEVQPKESLYK